MRGLQIHKNLDTNYKKTLINYIHLDNEIREDKKVSMMLKIDHYCHLLSRNTIHRVCLRLLGLNLGNYVSLYLYSGML